MRLTVPGAGSKFGILFFSIPELPAPSLACDVSAPGQSGIRPIQFHRKVVGSGHPVQSDQRHFVYCLGLGLGGRLLILDSSRIRINIASSSAIVSCGVEIQSLLLLVLALIVAGVVGVNHAFHVLIGHCQLH
ncbi:hypothetical protein PIB30_069329 [Stylosanthes scabra]|uniref:Uncharacterized protein n=1 Tax=Stylosanthes scabra TaxID=79078 RepID=A0ABU6RN50_9FABA|nr:hypothetical protein [Stylosanthes scabra]